MKTEMKTNVSFKKKEDEKKSKISKTQTKSKKDRYYIIVEEWKYPCGEHIEPVEMSFDSKSAALAYAGSMANSEYYNFMNEVRCHNCSMHKEKPSKGDCGSVVLRSNESNENWYFAARVIEIVKLVDFSD